MRAITCLAVGSMLALAACSTPGPAHVYLYSPAVYSPAAGEGAVRDIDPLTGAEIARLPSFVESGEKVLGLAYDPFTDHLFLRIFPGDFIRVVDRPAAKLKRVFRAPNLPLGGHDLAIRSRDRHLFFTDPTGPALIETDLYGGFESHIRLSGLADPVHGLAHDSVADEFLVLPPRVGDRLLRFSLRGDLVNEVKLERAVLGASLAYDAVSRTCYASLADGSAIGAFDERGRLLRTLSRPSADREVFIDIGPRSLLRLF